MQEKCGKRRIFRGILSYRRKSGILLMGNFRNCILKFKFYLSENIISFSSAKCR